MTITGDRVLNSEYLDARGQAWDAKAYAVGHHMDPILSDIAYDDTLETLLWFAFMAGSDWERKYRGSRYTDEVTGMAPWVDVHA